MEPAGKGTLGDNIEGKPEPAEDKEALIKKMSERLERIEMGYSRNVYPPRRPGPQKFGDQFSDRRVRSLEMQPPGMYTSNDVMVGAKAIRDQP